MKKLFCVLFILILAIGCQARAEENNPKSLKPITLSQAYPGDISSINKVELLDGSSGERKVVDDQELIQEWLGLIKDVELNPDDNQEPRTGYLFGITLFEGDTKKLGFTSFGLNHVYYQTNEQFVEPIRTLFEEQFE